MNSEKLFKIIGLIDDDLIEAAENNKPAGKASKKSWIRLTALAASVVFVISSGLWYVNRHSMLNKNLDGGGSGHGESSSFMHYEGPVLPLNADGDINGITASRNIHLDFSSNNTEESDLLVTDSYILTNNTSNSKTIDVIYPFISSISDSGRFTPELKLNGEHVETELLFGDYTGGFTGTGDGNNTTYNIANINSWNGYKSLLEDGSYFKAAQSEKPLKDQRVTVYTFYDVTYPKEYNAATLAIEFNLPRGSSVLTYGINGSRIDNESSQHQYNFFVGHNEGQKIIIIGEPPRNYKIQGYENGACEKKVNNITGNVKVETMMFSQVIRNCMEEYNRNYNASRDFSTLVGDELMYKAVVSMFEYTVLGNGPMDRYQWMRLDDIIGESYSLERVMYLKAKVTIPAGKSAEIESKFIKGASYDFTCADPQKNRGVKGYDMMTKLGSSLVFTEQRAGINLPDNCEIVRQNFGFDIKNNIMNVTLDMEQERYYIDIRVTDVNNK